MRTVIDVTDGGLQEGPGKPPGSPCYVILLTVLNVDALYYHALVGTGTRRYIIKFLTHFSCQKILSY